MSPPSLHLSPQTHDLLRRLLERRSRPFLIVVDARLDVVFGEPNALSLWEHDGGSSALRDMLRERFERTETNGITEHVIGPHNGLVVRVVPLSSAQGRFFGLFIEREARREDLNDAVKRFSLTPRETEVLTLMLDGLHAADIARRLNIAEVTVFDHFKSISRKTGARNRSDMLAKVFNWQSSGAANIPTAQE